MKTSPWLRNLAMLGTCLSIVSNLHAVNTWKNAPDGTFAWDGFNWDSPLSWVDGDDAIFGPAGIGAITLGVPVIAHNLTFNSPGYSIVGNTLTLDGASPTITANENVTIATRLLGTNGLRILGSSNVTLIGTPGVGGNQYTGGTHVVSGTVILQVSNLVIGTTYAIDSIEALDTGATVKYFNGISYTATTNNLRVPEGQLPINANTKLNLTGGTFDLNGDDNQNRQPYPTGFGTILNSSENSRAVLKMTGFGTTNIFFGQIMDGGPATNALVAGKVAHRTEIDLATGSGGMLVLAGSNSFSGFVRIGNGGTIKLQGAGTLGYAATINCPGRHMIHNNGLVDLNGTSQSVGQYGAGSGATIANNALGTTSILTVCLNYTNTALQTCSAAIKDNTTGTGGIVGLTKVGTAPQGLNGINTYSGDTTVSSGLLTITALSGISSNSTYRLSTTGGILDLNYAGTADVKALIIDGVAKPNGVYGSSTAPITGSGFIRVSNNRFLITQVVKNPNFDQLTITWDSLPGLTYTVQYSTDLGATWFTQDGGSNVPSQGNSTTFDINFSESGFIYRVFKQ